MKIRLNNSPFKVIKDKKGFSLMSAMVYMFLAVVITISLYNVMSNVWSKFLVAKFQEEFVIQKEQFHAMLNTDLMNIAPNSLTVTTSVKDPKQPKLTFKSKDTTVEVIQSSTGLVYKRVEVINIGGVNKTKTTAVDFNTVTSSSFNKINKVCMGENAPSNCFEVNNALDIVLRFEKRIVRNPISFKSGRVVYHE